MLAPKKPSNEIARLKALKSYGLLDTQPEEDYDNLTAMVADYCEAPISLVTLLDEERNFLKSQHGVPFNESPRDISFCGHAILDNNAIFIIPDARKDERFKDNPIVTEQGAVFYAGVPLIDPEGFALGTLCVFDVKPRELNDKQKQMLITLGKQIVKLFILHKNNNQLKINQESLKISNKRLKQFAGVVTHDLKSPLANITSLSRMLKDEYKSNFDFQGLEYLDYIEESSEKLAAYIEGMLKYYKSDELTIVDKQKVDIQDIFNELEGMLFINEEEFEYPQESLIININKPAVEQVLMNLIGNSLKYNNNKTPFVEVTFKQRKQFYEFSVTDNGIGIDIEKQKIIFELFKTATDKDKYGKKGSGIGLATVKKIVEELGGSINVVSEIGKGTTFTFTVAK
ncbi:sensor histidine kinase [Patiriisocius marinus]|uniref:histidine kinase n=1 Tax=Patiriisocius marinus TaxID=1397112 RepID=A0A5J4IW92_9FLAO|nr:GAF domain-containing sensor histidine kinase [Patiriisocius marinus]GER59254.1 sensor histidine kinase [Patiriisocius marinus]